MSKLVRLTGMYDSMNETVLNAARKLAGDMEPFLLEKGELEILLVGGIFYIDETKIRPGMLDVENFSFFDETLSKKSIGELNLKSPVQIDDLIYLAYAIKGGTEATAVQSALESKLKKGITIGGPIHLQQTGIDMRDTHAVAKQAYLKAVSAMQEIDGSLRAGETPVLKKAKRALQLIVDCVLKDESYILGFTTFRSAELYYHYHPVNVTILSVSLGKKIGFNRLALSRLAMSAFLHDIGKVAVPEEVLKKAPAFTPEETEQVRRHPSEGVKRLLGVMGLGDSSVPHMLVSFEHHMRLDLSGYPKTSPGRKLHLFSRIVNITDEFDNLVSGRVNGKKAHATEDALMLMYQGSGTLYDPSLFKAFIGVFK